MKSYNPVFSLINTSLMMNNGIYQIYTKLNIYIYNLKHTFFLTAICLNILQKMQNKGYFLVLKYKILTLYYLLILVVVKEAVL